MVETATYRSDFNAARTVTEQITDMRYTLCMLVVLVIDPYMFGARVYSPRAQYHTHSKSVFTTVPHSQLNKHHNALAYHRVREAISAVVMKRLTVRSDRRLSVRALTNNLLQTVLRYGTAYR